MIFGYLQFGRFWRTSRLPFDLRLPYLPLVFGPAANASPALPISIWRQRISTRVGSLFMHQLMYLLSFFARRGFTASSIHHPSSTIHELALFSNSSTPVSCHHCIIAVSGAGYLATSLPTDISWLLSGCCVVSSITSATIEHFLRPNLHVLFLCLCRHPTEPPLSSMPSHSTCAPHSRNLTSSYPVCSKQFIHSSHISPATPLSFQFFSVSPQYPPSAAPAPSSFEP